MTSQVLVEGISDVKDPRGSEDRKFWKAWHRQRVCFSVVYPSGSREPYLQLNLSNLSSEVSEREVRLSRDGLRLFRCRSKTRPYRTWAISSGNKVVLYFAAESEIQAQNWMQAVREGLWPPCFSFQVLTACSYEVSLIDDNNTFLSGLLGVYGRFVLTSEDIISLMHPYWGATSLEISLDNIIDVRFVREAEISPAGVFNILLKRVNGSKIKSLQFFCNTTKDAIQWILSKLYSRRKSLCVTENIKINKTICTIPRLNGSENSQDNSLVNDENVKISVLNEDQSVTTQEMDKKNITDLENEYENLQYFNKTSLSKNKSVWIRNHWKTELRTVKKKSEENGHEKVSVIQKVNGFTEDTEAENETLSVNANPSDNIYANITNGTNSNEQVHEKFSNEESSLPRTDGPTLPFHFTRTDSTIYAAINKPNVLKKLQQTSNEHLLLQSENITRENFTQINNSDDASSRNTKIENKNCIVRSNSSHVVHTDANFGNSEIDESEFESLLDIKKGTNGQLNEEESISNNLSSHTKTSQFSLNISMNYNANTYVNNSHLLPNLPSDFLDTSFNSRYLRNRNTDSGSSSSEEVTENLPWLKNEFENFSDNSHVYEDLLQRKGTVYEEIDDSDDESQAQSVIVPELPQRPQNLEIPDSLRLQKLSNSILHTLEVMEDPHLSTKEHYRPHFIKKIKDVNRVMHFSTNRENAKEPFTIELKFPTESKNHSF